MKACSDCLSQLSQILKIYLCCFKQQPPIFDYDEIDDLEFEQLLGNTTSQYDTTYEPEMTVQLDYNYEISSDEELEAREYTREEIDKITSKVVEPKLIDVEPPSEQTQDILIDVEEPFDPTILHLLTKKPTE
jgi:hypothetical protein